MGSLNLDTITSWETVGSDGANSGGTVVTAAGSTNAKGSWVELDASTAGDVAWLVVQIETDANAGIRFLLDVGTGGAGAEAVLIPDLHLDNSNGATDANARSYAFPVAIPSGTRLSARVAASTASATVRVSLMLGLGDYGGATPPGTVKAYGIVAGSTNVTNVDPGAVAHTDSAWVEIAASTSDPIRWLVFGVGRSGNNLGGIGRWLVDVATGAAGSEAVLVSDIMLSGSTQNDLCLPATQGFAVDVPAGTRLAVRARCSLTADNQRDVWVGLWGADAEAPAAGGGGQHAHASWGG